MTFSAPTYLWLLWLAAVLVGLVYAWHRRAEGRLQRLGSHALRAALIDALPRRRVWRAGLLLGSVVLLVLALAGPEVGKTYRVLPAEGVDILVAFDVSQSMMATDGDGGRTTRLERAKRDVIDLLGYLGGDRVGLVSFAGAAYLECPLTLDYEAFMLYLRELSPHSSPVPGTAIDEAIEVSMEAFERSDASSARAIFLVTDGEDHSDAAVAWAKKAHEAGSRLYVLGVGTPQGSPVPATDGTYLRDEHGELVLSRLGEGMLSELAAAGGGRYARSVVGDADLDTLYTRGIRAELDAVSFGDRREQRGENRFQWLIGLALACLAAEPLVSERRRPRRAA